ncbi:MAG TPA: hypothetical protein VND64_05385 [Pirellulales bacterium]|nr:hypothetical protein [Pirellulales bacterium]
MTPISPELQKAIRAAAGVPVHLTDPDTQERYVVIPETLYDRVRSLFDDRPLSRDEQLYFLREAGKRAGWDDPEMDVYNDLDPRTK